MKYFVILLLMSHFLTPSLNVHAQKKGDGSDLASTHADLVSLEACQLLLRERPINGNNETIQLTNERLHQQYNENQIRMTAINERYLILNQEIETLESGTTNSLDEANLALEELIDSLYQNFSIKETDFVSLSADEQLALISQEPSVQEWKAYIEELKNIQDQYISEQVALEAEYQQLNYDNEVLADQIEASKQSLTQRNQCQLYPYSTSIYPHQSELLQLNQADLGSLIVSIDDYLKEIVPKAYAKVSFQQIYDLFSRKLTLEEIQQMLGNKEIVQIDANNYQLFQYAKELSLFDIEQIASQSLADFYRTNQPENYRANYTSLLNLKESQFQYFYFINNEVFDEIKQFLADYLNNNSLINEDTIQQIRTLHERYQVKLVLFNQESQTWFPNSGANSGYLQSFTEKELLQALSNENTSFKGQSTKQEFPVKEKDKEKEVENFGLLKSKKNESENSNNEADDNLAYLKEKLTDRGKAKKTNQLAKPISNQAIDASAKNQNKVKPPLLPSTGEQRFYLNLAWGLFILGLFFLSLNRYFKYRQRKRLTEKIDSENDKLY